LSDAETDAQRQDVAVEAAAVAAHRLTIDPAAAAHERLGRLEPRDRAPSDGRTETLLPVQILDPARFKLPSQAGDTTNLRACCALAAVRDGAALPLGWLPDQDRGWLVLDGKEGS
jgi:hypothetical protein